LEFVVEEEPVAWLMGIFHEQIWKVS